MFRNILGTYKYWTHGNTSINYKALYKIIYRKSLNKIFPTDLSLSKFIFKKSQGKILDSITILQNYDNIYRVMILHMDKQNIDSSIYNKNRKTYIR